MKSRMDEFRVFVNLHPLLRDEVRDGKMTWQSIYEEWVLYGDENQTWSTYKKEEEKKESIKTVGIDKIKNAFGYVKKINTDNLNKTLNNVQKVIQIAQTVGGNKGVAVPAAAQATIFSDWWE